MLLKQKTPVQTWNSLQGSVELEDTESGDWIIGSNGGRGPRRRMRTASHTPHKNQVMLARQHSVSASAQQVLSMLLCAQPMSPFRKLHVKKCPHPLPHSWLHPGTSSKLMMEVQ